MPIISIATEREKEKKSEQISTWLQNVRENSTEPISTCKFFAANFPQGDPHDTKRELQTIIFNCDLI